jgi:hypothetical protein
MTNTSIEILPAQNIKAIFPRTAEGDMAETFPCNIEWSNGKTTRSYIKRFLKINNLSLVNEITGYLISRAAGLPIAKHAGIINAPNYVFGDSSNKYENFCFIVSSVPGDNPGSLYNMGMINNCKTLMDIVAGWSKVSDTIAFDDWVANQDRHLGNILVEGKNKVFLIDHGNLPVKLQWACSDLNINLQSVNVLENNLWNLNCIPMQVRASITASAKDHNVIYQTVKDELLYWWGVLLSNEPARIKSLESFIESRANLGMLRIASNYNILAV